MMLTKDNSNLHVNTNLLSKNLLNLLCTKKVIVLIN